jgi:hypothetical protein
VLGKITLNIEEGSLPQRLLAWLQQQPFVLHPCTSEAPMTINISLSTKSITGSIPLPWAKLIYYTPLLFG